MRIRSALASLASLAALLALTACQGSIQPPTDVPQGATVKGVAAPPVTSTTGAKAGASAAPAPPVSVAAKEPPVSAAAKEPPVSVTAKEPPRRTDVEIKSMTKDEIRGWREGRAMTLARVAEKNHYPAPYFALKLTSELALFEDQIAPMRAIHDALRRRAMQLGRQLLEEETKLQLYFEDQEKDPPKLEAIVRESARLRGEIRLMHLQADIETRKILNQDQLVKYEALRGSDPAEDGK
jgi:hypothetical protein